jgi:REP element-mobilizing transposase RayT
LPKIIGVDYDSFRHHRRSIRLKGYDYASKGHYFITICAHGHLPLLDSENARLIINKAWQALPIRFPHIRLDEFVIMPNHIHGIIVINRRGEPCVRPRLSGTPPHSLGRILQAFKSITTKRYAHAVNAGLAEPFERRLWQRNYYERIIRNEDELYRIRQYIRDNPLNWTKDPENPDVFKCRGEPCVRPARDGPGEETV